MRTILRAMPNSITGCVLAADTTLVRRAGTIAKRLIAQAMLSVAERSL